jgi:hypothetical protein
LRGEHQLYRFGNFSSTSQENAQSNIDVPIPVDEYEQLNSGILLDPLLKPGFHLDASHLLVDIGQIASI